MIMVTDNEQLTGHSWNILVIDDSKLSRAIVKKTLSDLGMSITEASDGMEGLELLATHTFDLILVDIIMPNLDGFGFLERFPHHAGDDFVPVILMTGSDDLNSKIKGLSIGADDFLLKPLNEKELVARVMSLLRLKNTHDELYEKNLIIKKELEYAKKLQQYIIPENFEFVTYPSVKGRYLPIADIGGDLFDCYLIDEHRTGIVIADVTGHGIPAALVMTMSKMLFSIYAPDYDTTSQLMSKVNEEMRGLLLDMQYITAFYIMYDTESKILRFTNAGHTRPMFYRRNTGKVMALDTNGLFIGIKDDTYYEEKSIKVENGDRLLLYTDGITEHKNDQKEEYGETRLARYVRENGHIHGDQFCDSLLEHLESFSTLDNRTDDIALVYIEF